MNKEEIKNRIKNMPLKKIRDINLKEVCNDPQHNPPMYRCFGPGEYEWTCPTCGEKQRFTIYPFFL